MASVVVTGTSKGIGLETALILARAGHTVYATMRNPARAPELGQRAAAEGLPVHISPMDVDSDDSVAHAIEEILAKAGKIDVLVNNAGVAYEGTVEEMPMAELKGLMETNYFGAIRCIKAIVPGMRQQRSGCIVNVTSVAGRLSTSPLGPYAASKHALEALSDALAQELKLFGVRVAVVEPGVIDTPMARSIEGPKPSTIYPQAARFAALFAASLRNPTPPSVVGDKILEIIDSGTEQFRHLAGPDAGPTLASRMASTDEQHIALWGADDDTWYTIMEKRMKTSLRPAK